MPYAEETRVPIERSRTEIERTLERYGATAFSYGWDEQRAVLAFRAHGRMIRLELPIPTVDDAAAPRPARSAAPATPAPPSRRPAGNAGARSR